MRGTTCSMAMAALLLAAAGPANALADEIVEKRTIRRTVPAGQVDGLIVDVFHGSVELTGGAGEEVKIVVHETIRADDERELERARSEVTLEIGMDRGRILICADGPFKDPDDCTEWARNSRYDPGYTVIHDIELEVPRRMNVDVSSVFGDLDVSGVTGGFDVRGVDGDVRVGPVSGSGRVQNVNGPVRVTFVENPAGDCEFGTVNGDIDVGFEPGLSADLSFKTMNGEALTDFEYSILPPEPLQVEVERDRTVYRMEARPRIRIGRGGPRMRFENINGEILIRKNK